MNVAVLSIENLAAQCAEETEKFSRRQPNATQYCFELFRRALADGIAEAFTRIYQVYERQVLNWVYRYPRFEETGEGADFFVNSAFSKFYFAVSGPKFERFNSVPSLLMYLKLCVHTAIAQYIRDQKQIVAVSTDDEAAGVDMRDRQQEDLLESGTKAADLWALICRLLPAPTDQLLARCAFTLDMKPAEITTAYPGRWGSEREISVALYRIRRLLRQNAELRRLLGLPAAEAEETDRL
jgi:hypothetical protein